jgi:hypothetical protein
MIQKQDANEPLFPEIEWEAPQNVKQRGELLIVGGSPHGFASVANSYEYAKEAGIGRAKVVMPIATENTVKDFIDDIAFLPSTPSGSFSKKGLTELKAYAQESWGTLLAGEFGRNSETASLIEGFLMSTSGKVIISKDAVNYASTSYPRPILQRENTLLIASLSQLQKLLKNAGVEEAVKFEMGIDQLAKYLEALSDNVKLALVTMHHKHLFVAANSRVTVTPLNADETLWQTRIAAYCSVYWLQHDSKPVEGISTGVYESLSGFAE